MGYGMNDDDYVYAFEQVSPRSPNLYQPEIVLVSAGFDTYHNDPLGGMAVTGAGLFGA